MSKGNYLAFPFRIGADGRAAQVVDEDEHLRDEVYQLILTSIGERLFLPELGTNVRRLVFENTDATTAGMTKGIITDALTRWLGHRLTIEGLEVAAEGGKLTVDLRYRAIGAEDSRRVRFERKGD